MCIGGRGRGRGGGVKDRGGRGSVHRGRCKGRGEGSVHRRWDEEVG